MRNNPSLKNLSDCISLFNGFAFKSNDRTEDGVLWVKIGNVSYGKISESNQEFLPRSFLKDYEKYVLHENDIVVALTRPITNGKLKIAKVNGKFNNSLLNQRVARVDVKNNFCLGYIYQLLRSDKVLKDMSYNLLGTDPPNLANNTLENIKVFVPLFEEQQKIAKILSTWDDAIEKLEKLIEAKKLRKKGLMQQLLTGKKRFDGFDGEVELKKIGKFSKSFSGGTPNRSKKEYYKDGTIPWMKSGEVNQRYIREIEEKITKEALKHSSAKIVKKDTVVVALYGATAGKVGITEIETATNQAVLAIFPDETVDYKFLFHSLEFIIPHYIGYAQGGQANLSGEIIREISLRVPVLLEQKKISGLCEMIDLDLMKLDKKKRVLIKQKKGLMQQLLTGKKRVKIDNE